MTTRTIEVSITPTTGTKFTLTMRLKEDRKTLLERKRTVHNPDGKVVDQNLAMDVLNTVLVSVDWWARQYELMPPV
jgi:hypothetical protein